MAKGPIITPEVENLIVFIHEKHRRWTANMVCNEARSTLRKKNPRLPKDWPSLSTVQKILARVRKEVGRVDPKDGVWSLGSLLEYPMSPEALPAVMEAYSDLDIWSSADWPNPGYLTVREALWLARLYKLIEDPGLLLEWAYQYAMAERYSEITGRALNTTPLDYLFVTAPQGARGSRDSRELAQWYENIGPQYEYEMTEKGRQNERKHKTTNT